MRENLQGFLEDFAIVVARGYVGRVEIPDPGVHRQPRRLPRRQVAILARQVGLDVEVGRLDDQRIGLAASLDQVVRSGAIAHVNQPGPAVEGAEDLLWLYQA